MNVQDEIKKHFALRVLRGFCPSHLYEEIEGDLIQRFNRDTKTLGGRKAKRNLVWNTIRFIRPGIILRNSVQLNPFANMFGNNVMLFRRQVMRNKTFSIITMAGLTAAITVCLLVAQFVSFERSFEDFNPNAENTYRVNLSNAQNGVFDRVGGSTVPGLAYSMKQSIPGITSIARIGSRRQGIISNKDRQMGDREDLIFAADPSIVDALNIEFIDGDKAGALKAKQTIILSESMSLKYFGDTHASGKVLEIGFTSSSIEIKPYEVQGVFKDSPANTHLHVDFIIPIENEQAWNENWDWSEVSTYVVLSEKTTAASLGPALSKIVKEHHKDGIGDQYILEPIRDIRMHALDGSGSYKEVKFFILLAAIILLLAWFNYINLSTARFFERMKEVGVRKLIGASRRQLSIQFLTEAFFFNVISFLCALILFILLWPFATQFLNEDVSITLFNYPNTYFAIVVFIATGTLCSGMYPSLFLSSFQPLQSLKGKISDLVDRSFIRKAIVVVQLTVSIVLFTAVVAIQRQIEFMRSSQTGLSINQTLIIDGPLLTDATSVNKYELFKNEMLKQNGVSGVTYASSYPGAEIDWHRTDITLGQENAAFHYDSRIISIGTEFLDVFDLPLLSGRNFNPEIESDNKTMLISEAASKMFGFSTHAEALGKLIFIGSRRFEVIGIVKDHHFRSLQHQIQPVLYIQGYPRNPSYAIKLTAADAETIGKIGSTWKQTYAGNIFKYYFLDESFDKQYKSDQQAGEIVSGLTLIGILISCSGLFGLSIYAVGRRTREIGIRKVLGASAPNVVMLLSKDFLTLIVIGSALAMPLIFKTVNLWLQRYAYKMPLSPWLFVVPVLAVSMMAWITISFQTISAARKNPVDSMKYE